MILNGGDAVEESGNVFEVAEEVVEVEKESVDVVPERNYRPGMAEGEEVARVNVSDVCWSLEGYRNQCRP